MLLKKQPNSTQITENHCPKKQQSYGNACKTLQNMRKLEKYNRFHKLSVQTQRRDAKTLKTCKSQVRWLRPGGCPYVGSLAARPPEPPGSPAPHRRRVASARNAFEIQNIAEFFILQMMKSMKCSWHSFNNIRFPIKTLKKLISRFAGDCCIAFPIPISIKKKKIDENN